MSDSTTRILLIHSLNDLIKTYYCKYFVMIQISSPDTIFRLYNVKYLKPTYRYILNHYVCEIISIA
jgi:hypothetical protein